MYTESSTRPERAEFYDTLTRVNFDVTEEETEVDGETVTTYKYEMVEIRRREDEVRNMDLEDMTNTLLSDRYPIAEQVRLLASGTLVEVSAFKNFRALCKKTAREVLGLHPNEKEERQNAINAINAATDEKILTGFSWNGKNVYLSTENQFNFKAAYDLAVQTNGATLPIKFKFGEDSEGNAVYHTFNSLNAFTDFYTSAIAYINRTLNEGWMEKDSLE